MSGPWTSVLAIAGLAVGGLLLFFLALKAEGLRNALNQTFRIPLLLGLILGGVAASALILTSGIGSSIAMPFMLGAALVNLSDAARPRWVGPLMWLDGAVLLALSCRAWLLERPLFEGWVELLLGLLILSAALWTCIAGLIVLIRLFRTPMASSSETGTPA